MNFSFKSFKFGKSKHKHAEEKKVAAPVKAKSSSVKKMKQHGSEFMLLMCGLLSGVVVFGALCGFTYLETVPVKKMPPSVIDGNAFRNTSMIRQTVTPFGDMGFVPVIPVLPELPQAEKGVRDAIRIVGLMPPKMVILQQNGKRISAVAGSETPIGRIGEITAQGCYIDGEFVKYK